jgi:glycerol-3-phosphate O-acyltransferase
MREETISSPPAPRVPPEGLADPLSAMTDRYNLFFRWFAKRYFQHIELDEGTLATLRGLEERGSVVYVMRYASRLDYFLFNTLFARHGLRLSAFANGIRFWYYRPIVAAARAWWLGRSQAEEVSEDPEAGVRSRVRRLVDTGESLFLFLRTERLRSWLAGREAAVEQGRRQRDLLTEMMDAAWTDDRPVFLVPIALFWRKGPRASRRVLNLAYGAPTRPGDFAKVTSFFLAYRQLAVKVGDPIDLAKLTEARREEGKDALVRKVRRAILLFLYREERVVEGPTLPPRHRVQEAVLSDPSVRAAIALRSEETRSSLEAAQADAEKSFREIAANMNSSFFMILNFVVTGMFRRMFAGIETLGIEKVAEYAKRDPVVLVPSHRSYFDFLILTWLFYGNYLVPPHIAARDNMAFGPFGFIFRRVGAYFLRASFDDALYKEVFRSYVSYLVREGFTQEFFIEGGRSRTGKTLAPRLGMVSWNVEAFARSHRRDLYFVPVAITYERLVEESSIVEESEGGEKKKESMLALVRARKYLQRRFGSVFVNFGEPVSLAQALDGRRDLFLEEGDDSQKGAKRALIERLGNELVERINWAMVANATSVAACALLGQPRRGLFRSELTARMRDVTDLLKLQDVRMTPALLADEPEFEESIQFLLRADLIQSAEDPRGEILFYEESRRRALDVYRNVLFHFLAGPSFLARRLLRSGTVAEVRKDLAFWLDLFYGEFFLPKATILNLQLDAFLDYFERVGVLERRDGQLVATEKGRGYFEFLAEQTRSVIEAYYAAFTALLAAEEELSAKQLEKLASEHFERASLLGEVRRREGMHAVTFRNALELLERRGVLATRRPEKGDRLYGPGPAHEELVGLRERLAGALGQG